MAARNVGEWSEIYAVARLLTNDFSHDSARGEKKIIRAKVQHSIAEPAVEYAMSDHIISVKQGNRGPFDMERKEISRLANDLLDDMQSKSDRTFQSNAGMRLVELLRFGGTSAALRDDIRVVFVTGKTTDWKGVSIKSFIGAKPTLLNASSATNFVYKLTGPQNSLRKVSKLNKITMKPLFDFFRENQIDLAFESMDNAVFSKSLQGFSPDLDAVIARLLREAAFQPKKKLKDVWGLTHKSGAGVALVADAGLLQFLGAVGLGLQPATRWGPRGDDFGGFLNIKPGGAAELVGEANLEALGAQLFQTLKFEWGSRTRHKFGIPFKVGSELMIKLNLQLRY
jgi:hypothetical protein